MDMDLRSKRVLVTGASKGIGRACAEAFAAEGCDIILVSRNAEALEAAAEGIRKQHNVGVTIHAADLSEGAARSALAEAHPTIDVLVNNAGAIPGGRLADITMDRWSTAWALKVMGYIHLCQLYMPQMEAAKSGAIVNIIGMAGQAPRADYICGAAGNAALIAFTRALGGASPAHNVRVTGINPAATRTDRIVTLSKNRAQQKYGDESRWEEMLEDLPFGRPAEPEEIAWLSVFLASARGAYLSGTVVDVDGGNLFRK
ncbi:MAG: Short-chain dehydrogenase [Rhodospirillales bacterium]|jgi:3-oxoacyl-[acyl-carrier protein] reductase|nr:Short-chain dehydrogenase [Rhodospirillales bacterium]